MKHILLLGAGRSTLSLIEYLLKHAAIQDWHLKVADMNVDWAREKFQGNSRASVEEFYIQDESQRRQLVHEADLIISMLPARFHPLVAACCLTYNKPLFTASYTSSEIRAMDEEVRSKGLLFLMECGLDPGLDHMSAMRVIDHIRRSGNQLTGFESFTGGLLSPSQDENPWGYKFTWNPRNVVLAGSGGAKFIQNGTYKYIPYHKLFKRIEIIHIPGHGRFEGYANRDSLRYLDVYKLQNVKTLYRGTLRPLAFVRLGCLCAARGYHDSFEMENVEGMTHRDFINSFSITIQGFSRVKISPLYAIGLGRGYHEPT